MALTFIHKEITGSGEYSNEKEVDSDLQKFFTHKIGLSRTGTIPYLAFKCKVSDTEWFPVLDVDEKSNIDLAERWLSEWNFSSVKVQSSPDHVWFLIDKISTLDQAIKLIELCPYADPKFAQFSKSRKHICLRAFLRNLFIPRFYINKEATYSRIFKLFVQDIYKHFNHDAVRFIGILDFFRNLNSVSTKDFQIIFRDDTDDVFGRKIEPCGVNLWERI